MKYWVRDTLKEKQTCKLFNISAIEMAHYATVVFITIDDAETNESRRISLQEIDEKYNLEDSGEI